MTEPDKITRLVLTANGREVVESEEAIEQYNVEGKPVAVMIPGPWTMEYWKGNGGQEPTYQINDNGTLAIWFGDELGGTFGPTGWTFVSGPAKIGPHWGPAR